MSVPVRRTNLKCDQTKAIDEYILMVPSILFPKRVHFLVDK